MLLQNTEKLPLQLQTNALLSKVHRANTSIKTTVKRTFRTCIVNIIIVGRVLTPPADPQLFTLSGKRDTVGEPLLLISSSQSHTHAAQLRNIRIETTGWPGGEGAELLLPMNGHNHRGDCM